MTDWTNLFGALDAAQAILANCEMAETTARANTFGARAALNAAQRDVDKALGEARRSSPRDTDWHRAAHPTVACGGGGNAGAGGIIGINGPRYIGGAGG